ncbi:MAG: aspartate--tRNA ligase [Bacilli bacterium]
MKNFNNGEFRLNDINKTVTVYGWVNKKRNMGGLTFIDLRDRSGIIQIVLNKSTLKINENIIDDIKNEYCIKVTGEIAARANDMKNLKMATGEIELIASDIEIIGESEALPFNINGGSLDTTENNSLKYRYLDLRREALQKNIIMRAKITTSVRNYLNSNYFLEIETPVLCKSTPEGARDYIVPSRVSKGSFYALPQSPQLFKQLLMLSGFERYYQVAKCFRDEDLRADRQPEFTQIDMEMSFVDQEDVINMVEGLLKHVLKEVKNITLPDFPRMTWNNAMDNYGSDKPDTRFDMLLKDLTEILRGTSFNLFNNVIESNGIIKCIVVKNNATKYSRKEIDNLTEFVKIYGTKGISSLKYENDAFTGSLVKNIEIEKLNKIKDELNIENNDLILIVADKPNIVWASLGALRIKIAKELNLIDNDKLNFLWVVDFPMFEYSETDNRWKATHHPFTMPKNIEEINDPVHCLSDSYDIVLNGYELGGGSVRIHDPKTQRIVFDALGLTEDEIKTKFGFFIEAFKYGSPNHAGLAIGLERFTMLMCGTDNIKDVIAFPKTQSASDLMSEAPSIVTNDQLKDLGIEVIKGIRNE